MSVSPQTLSEEDWNLLKYDRIKFECGPMVYRTIIDWGFEKPDGVTIKDHLETKKIEKKSGIKLEPWLKKNKRILEKENFSNFDLSTLNELLPVLCYDKITQTAAKEWEDKLKDENSIEYLLNEIRTFRTDVSYDYNNLKLDPNVKSKKISMIKCIRAAGTLYGKHRSQIDSKVADLEAKFDELVHEITNSYKNSVKNVTKLIEKESAPFMLGKYSPLFTVPLPSGLGNIQSSEIFKSVDLSVAVKGKSKSKIDVISSFEICNHVTNKFVVINGGPGSGKTTLMRNIFQNILENSVNGSNMSYEGISRFKVPIYLECRTDQQYSLLDFLLEIIPNIKSPKEVIYDAFKEVKGLIFLIDGYGEANDDIRKLIDEIIHFCKKSDARCIVSSRVDARYNISNLKRRIMRYKEMLIEPFNELRDKLSFLRRYGDKMGDGVNSDELVKSFENLNEAVEKVFFSPVHLVLFISLFLNNRTSLSQLHNEQSAYKAMRETFPKVIENNLRESNVKNAKLTTEDILAVLYDHSLRLFRSKEYYFGNKDLLSLVRDCEQILSRDFDIYGLLACILTPKTSLKSGKALAYAFPHSTIQEYLAAEQIKKNMRERKIDWSSEQLSEDSLRMNFFECVGESSTCYDVREMFQRYGNIIKLLILEILSDGELTKYTKTFTAVLREYFGYDEIYILDLVSSSNCDSTIVSIFSNVLRYLSSYRLFFSRHIRPMTEVLKNMENNVKIEFYFSESLRDIDCANLGQLVSLLKDGSEIKLDFRYSYDNYQPLNGEFYTQLKNSKCKVTEFRACLASSEHLYILMRVYRGNTMWISTVSVHGVCFVTLEAYEGILYLRVKYSDDCPRTGSNPVTGETFLTITDIPADGKEKLYNILKYFCPKSREFRGIELDNCHMTDSATNELLKKLEGEKIRTRWGTKTEMEERRVKRDKSRCIFLYSHDVEKQEAEQRETEQQEAEQRETEQLETEHRKIKRRKHY